MPNLADWRAYDLSSKDNLIVKDLVASLAGYPYIYSYDETMMHVGERKSYALNDSYSLEIQEDQCGLFLTKESSM